MRRLAVIAGLVVGGSGAPSAFAEPPDSCLRTTVSVYFAGNATQPTPAAADALARTGRDLAMCGADRVSVVARFSPGGGRGALDLSLSRLAEVAEALSRAGVDVSRIRLAALPSQDTTEPSGPGRVDVWTGPQAAPAQDPRPAQPTSEV